VGFALLAMSATVSAQHLRKPKSASSDRRVGDGETLVKIKDSVSRRGTPTASLEPAMTSVTANCSISTRTAYFGTRRIAPVAATSRIEALGARPAVEELRPARRHPHAQIEVELRPRVLPLAAFAAQVIGQLTACEEYDPQSPTLAYRSADRLGRTPPSPALGAI
jgi:hypothetical protein